MKKIVFAALAILLSFAGAAFLIFSGQESPVLVDSPKAGERLSSPILIEGKAIGTWFFEASFPIKLVDENGRLIAQSIAQAKDDWMTTDYVRFESKIEFKASTEQKAILVFQKDNPSGLPQYDAEYKMPVVLVPDKSLASGADSASADIVKIKVYFNNANFDPEFTCVKVFPVEREIAKTSGVARAAIEELLKGPTEQEKAQDYITNINSGVKIQKLVIENGIAKVDFDGEIERAVGGSCRVSAIRSQITQTLKQFLTVKEVVISVDGRTEDALQP